MFNTVLPVGAAFLGLIVLAACSTTAQAGTAPETDHEDQGPGGGQEVPEQAPVTIEGSGNQSTDPVDLYGDYEVSYEYSENAHRVPGRPGRPGGSGSQGTDFIVEYTDDGRDTMDLLATEVEESGAGSANITGADGSYIFHVQATGDWTMTITPLDRSEQR